MRFLADENFPGAAVRTLVALGHDVIWVRVVAPGMSDSDVLAWAEREARILLTFDKDFGELARASAQQSGHGIVLFRIPIPRPAEVGEILARRLSERDDWIGHFAVIEAGRIRMRRLTD